MSLPTTMQGVVLPGEKQLETREFSVPQPGHGQVTLEIKASGLCGSDLRAIYRPKEQGHGPEAYKGVIAGHEPCGVVAQIGTGVSRFKVGDRVAAYHIVGCGLCAPCQAGWMINCHSESRAAYGWQRDGGHAPYMLAEERTLVKMPDELTFLDGAMVACGFGTAYAACLRANFGARPGLHHWTWPRRTWRCPALSRTRRAGLGRRIEPRPHPTRGQTRFRPNRKTRRKCRARTDGIKRRARF